MSLVTGVKNVVRADYDSDEAYYEALDAEIDAALLEEPKPVAPPSQAVLSTTPKAPATPAPAAPAATPAPAPSPTPAPQGRKVESQTPAEQPEVSRQRAETLAKVSAPTLPGEEEEIYFTEESKPLQVGGPFNRRLPGFPGIPFTGIGPAETPGVGFAAKARWAAGQTGPNIEGRQDLEPPELFEGGEPVGGYTIGAGRPRAGEDVIANLLRTPDELITDYVRTDAGIPSATSPGDIVEFMRDALVDTPMRTAKGQGRSSVANIGRQVAAGKPGRREDPELSQTAKDHPKAFMDLNDVMQTYESLSLPVLYSYDKYLSDYTQQLNKVLQDYRFKGTRPPSDVAISPNRAQVEQMALMRLSKILEGEKKKTREITKMLEMRSKLSDEQLEPYRSRYK